MHRHRLRFILFLSNHKIRLSIVYLSSTICAILYGGGGGGGCALQTLNYNTIGPLLRSLLACDVICNVQGQWIAYRPIVCRNGRCLYFSSNHNQTHAMFLNDEKKKTQAEMK